MPEMVAPRALVFRPLVNGNEDSLTDGFCALERFSFECRKVIGFAITTLRDWLKRFPTLFHSIRKKPKPIVTRSHAFPRALRQLHVISSSFDWFTVLSVSFVIG